MKKTAGQKTKEKILEKGLQLWPDITLQAVAKATGLTHPAILYHFPGNTLKDAIAEHAIEQGASRVIVQLMASGHKAAEKLSMADKIRHFNAI